MNVSATSSHRFLQTPNTEVVKSALKGICTICQTEFRAENKPLLMFQCGHVHHSQCCSNWLRQSASCPNCLEEVDSYSIEHFTSLFELQTQLAGCCRNAGCHEIGANQESAVTHCPYPIMNICQQPSQGFLKNNVQVLRNWFVDELEKSGYELLRSTHLIKCEILNEIHCTVRKGHFSKEIIFEKKKIECGQLGVEAFNRLVAQFRFEILMLELEYQYPDSFDSNQNVYISGHDYWLGQVFINGRQYILPLIEVYSPITMEFNFRAVKQLIEEKGESAENLFVSRFDAKQLLMVQHVAVANTVSENTGCLPVVLQFGELDQVGP